MRNNRRLSLLLVTVFVIGLLTGSFVLPVVSVAAGQDDAEILPLLIKFVQENYAGKVETADLIRGAIRGIMETVGDKYSVYMEPEQYTRFTTDVAGKFGGVGLRIEKQGDYVSVLVPLKGTPADRAGIKSGDKIIEVNGESMKGKTLDEVGNKLRGEIGTEVKVVIEREGQPKPLTFVLKREEIVVPSVTGKMLDGQVGYLEIASFAEETGKEVKEALADLEKQGAKGYILDLRNNPGGLLSSAVEVAGNFIPPGTVVRVVPKSGKPEIHRTEGQPINKPLVVLVNGESASAAEILAGAIRDWQTGTLVGTKTYGKGTVQTTIPLGYLGGIKLTVAQYTTPNGESINGKGIIPDVVVELPAVQPIDEIMLKYTRDLKRDMVGLDVLDLQNRLMQLGYYWAETDGVYNAVTEAAVTAFQIAQGLPGTGIADQKTIEALNHARVKQPEFKDTQLEKALEVVKEKMKTGK